MIDLIRTVRVPALCLLLCLSNSIDAQGAKLDPAIASKEQVTCEQDAADVDSSATSSTGAVTVTDRQQLNGKLISAIRYRRTNVFDPQNPKENNALFRFLNRLHFNTRSSVLASSLLLKKGDEFNADLVAETERILRSLPYLGYAEVQVERGCGDSVELIVITRDVWTTEPIVNLSREGGDTKHGFGFKEGNVLGYGNAVSLVYEKSPERSRTQYNFYSPHLFGTHMRMRLGFAENSDGQESIFELRRPFYSLRSRWAFGVSNVDGSQVEKIRFGDEILNRYRHGQERHQGFLGAGTYSSDDVVHRISVGINQDRDNYEETPASLMPVPVDTNFVYPWIEYQYLQNKYGVYRNLDLLHRVEDVPLGINFKVQAGYGGNVFGNDVDVFKLNSRYQDVIGLGEHHIVKLKVTLDSTRAPSEAEYNESWWGGQIQYYFLAGERHRYYAAVEYYQGQNLLQHNEFGAGGEHGLRGYPLDYQRGDKRVLFTLENRYITPWHILSLMRLGVVGFVDAGRAWGRDYGETPFLANVGVGLRLSSSKAKLDHIAHLDLATPLVGRDAVDEYQLVMKVESHF